MNRLNFEKMLQISGGKMFGREQSAGPCVSGSMVVRTTYYAFWIPFTSTDVMPC